MIKVFRRFRRMFLSQNRFSKYLLYAIGEIVLVVIGILIALQLNNRNEIRKSNAKVDHMLVQLKSELNTNVENCQIMLVSYEYRDSLITLIKQNKLTREDYQKNPRLLTLINYYSSFEIEDYYTKALINNIDQVPDKYEEIIKEISTLDSYYAKNIRRYIDVMATFNQRMHERWAEKYTWFSEPRDLANLDERIDFFLNDPAYINDVRLYSMYSKDNLELFSRQYIERSNRILDMLEDMELED